VVHDGRVCRPHAEAALVEPAPPPRRAGERDQRVAVENIRNRAREGGNVAA